VGGNPAPLSGAGVETGEFTVSGANHDDASGGARRGQHLAGYRRAPSLLAIPLLQGHHLAFVGADQHQLLLAQADAAGNRQLGVGFPQPLAAEGVERQNRTVVARTVPSWLAA